MYTVVDDFTCVSIVYKYLCINGLYTAAKQRGDFFFPNGNGRKSTVCFPLHIQSLSRPWVKLKRPPPHRSASEACARRKRPTFLEAPGQKLACGVPTFLSCWGRRVARLAGPRGTWAAVYVVALQSPLCVSALCVRRPPAARQSCHQEESLCGRGPGRVLWMCSVPVPSQDSVGGTVGHHETVRQIWSALLKAHCDQNPVFSSCVPNCYCTSMQ